MCCDLCPDFEDCEQTLGEPECCCPRCSEYDDCASRLEMDTIGMGVGDGTEDFDLWP
jgi:hypothetical protein